MLLLGRAGTPDPTYLPISHGVTAFYLPRRWYASTEQWVGHHAATTTQPGGPEANRRATPPTSPAGRTQKSRATASMGDQRNLPKNLRGALSTFLILIFQVVSSQPINSD